MTAPLSDKSLTKENPPAVSAGFALSSEDVERLLIEDMPDIRIDVLRKIALNHVKRTYSLREIGLAEQILRVLVRDTEISVREALSTALSTNPHVPHDIILSLANDVDSVAMPVLECSSVLTDSDLIALIRTAQNISKSAAIARRKALSQEVSAALVATRDMQLVAQLIKNLEATLPEEILESILQDHGKNPDIVNTMAQRPNLPVTVVEKIITLVSGVLAENLRVQYNIAPGVIAAETEKTREIATLRLVDGHISPRDVEKLIEQLQVFGRLTPSLILTSLCRGNLYFFETSLARLSSIPVRNAQLLIHDKGGRGFEALYSKAGLPEKFFAACKFLLEVVADMQRKGENGNGGAYANALAQRLLARAAGRNIENLSYIIALVRQHA